MQVQREPYDAITPVMDGIFNVEGCLTIVFSKDRREFRVATGRVKNLRFVKR